MTKEVVTPGPDPDLPSLSKLGPLLNVFAMRYGGSEVSHLDLGDAMDLYALVVVLGDFEAGDFLLPHLRLRIPLPRRSVLLVSARKLVHHTADWTGKRFVITGFVDYNTALHAGIKEDEFWDLEGEELVKWLRARVDTQLQKVRAKEAEKAAKEAAKEAAVRATAEGAPSGLRRSTRLQARDPLSHLHD